MSTMSESLSDEPVEVEIVDTELVYEGRVWDVRSDTFRYGEGEIVRQYVDHPGAAAVVAVDDEGRVLLIQQYRHPIRRRDWEIPAGRELAEEVDLEAERWESLVSIFTTPGGNDEVVHLFLARGLRSVGTPHDREDEEADIRQEWMPLGQAVEGVLAAALAKELKLADGAVARGRFRNGILAVGVLAASHRLHEAAAKD